MHNIGITYSLYKQAQKHGNTYYTLYYYTFELENIFILCFFY